MITTCAANLLAIMCPCHVIETIHVIQTIPIDYDEDDVEGKSPDLVNGQPGKLPPTATDANQNPEPIRPIYLGIDARTPCLMSKKNRTPCG